MRFAAFLVVFLIATLSWSQATNLGTFNCQPSFVANLSSPYNETSGLVFLNDTILSINDSGNTAQLHAMRASDGQHLMSWSLTNAVNEDWEALTQSESQLYIADIGDNMGNRVARTIYMLPKSQLTSATNVLSVQQLYFQFADQPSTGLQMNAHNFDCEALFYWQDSLHLFTKNWENLWTKHYVLPASWQDTIQVLPRDSFYVDGLVTDAAIDPSTQVLYLLGYKKEQTGLYSSFMYRFNNNQGSPVFESAYQRFELGSTLTLAQTEGICLTGSETGFISGEQISSIITIAPKLHRFDLNAIAVLDPPTKPLIYFNNHFLYIPQELLPDYQLVDTNGKVAISWVSSKNHQDLGGLKPGTYFLIGPNYRRTWVKLN